MTLKRRLDRLETGGSGLPHHLPPEQWSDEQLMRLITAGGPHSKRPLTDAELETIARGEADLTL